MMVHFNIFLIGFKIYNIGFLAMCGYLIGVNACHLKYKYVGVLLSTNYLDGNNKIFIIAFVIIEYESKKLGVMYEKFITNF